MTRIVIAGGGLAGCLAALALAKRRPDVELLLVEQGEAFGGNHTWSFFDTDVPAECRWVIEDIQTRRWPDHEVHFPSRSRTIPIGYNSMRSDDLDAAARSALRPDQYRCGARIAEVAAGHLLLEGGERIEADGLIDARGPGPMPGQDLGWQKFVGRIFRFARPHGVERPVIMDATVPQHDGYRFLYFLPLTDTDLLIEDTYYSPGPLLDHDLLRERIGQAARKIDGGGEAEVIEEESGVLPLLIAGDFEPMWPADDPLPRLGLRGGFFHPTTSYSLPDAVANAALLAEQKDCRTSALAALLRGRSREQWRQRSFFQLLNRMLFRAAEPDQSYRVLEHFYRLSPDLIARFYAARLSTFDKLRIISGKPPVPIGRALSAMWKSAA